MRFSDLIPQIEAIDGWPDHVFPGGSRDQAILALQTMLDGIAANAERARRIARNVAADADHADAHDDTDLDGADHGSSILPGASATIFRAPSGLRRRLHQGRTMGGRDPATLRWSIWATANGTRLELVVEQSLPDGCEARSPRSGAGSLVDLLSGLKALGSELSDEFARPVRR